jgi:hypothetical protein
VHHPTALLKEAEFTWTRDLAEASRFEDARAEQLKTERLELPLLPTDPPIVPACVRAVHGHYEEPELPALKPAPELLAERERRHASVLVHVEASAPKILPDECYRRTAARQGERD